MKDLMIEIPEGYEFDYVENGKVKLKPKALPKTWEECRDIFKKSGCRGYFVFSEGTTGSDKKFNDAIDLPTKSLAKAMAAFYKLLAAREIYRNGWVPDWNTSEPKHVIVRWTDTFDFHLHTESPCVLSFQTELIRDEFYKNFKELIEEAKELL